MSEEVLQIAEEKEKQRAREKGKDLPTECRLPNNSKER